MFRYKTEFGDIVDVAENKEERQKLFEKDNKTVIAYYTINSKPCDIHYFYGVYNPDSDNDEERIKSFCFEHSNHDKINLKRFVNFIQLREFLE